MKITEELVDYVSTLSRLKLEADERSAMTAELEQIVSYMDVLERVDTRGVEPLSHVLPVCNVTRSDVVEPSYDAEALLKGAPKRDQETFLVPKAVE